MSLTELIKDIHSSATLKPALDIHLRQVEDLPSNRAPGWHPSEFCDGCARHKVMARLLDKEEPFLVSPQLRRIFDYGTALHEWFQNEYLGPMGILWGRWRCSRCHVTEWGFMPTERHNCDPAKATLVCRKLCAAPGAPLNPKKMETRGGCMHCGLWGKWEYKEVPVLYHHKDLKEGPIVGHSDGLVMIDGCRTLEMKSINSFGFSKLTGPKPGHRNQAELYGGLIRRGMVDCPKGVKPPKPEGGLVVYLGKDRSVEKEYPFDFDDKLYDRLIAHPFYVEQAFREKRLPPRHVECKTRVAKRAQDCKLNAQCFGKKSWAQLVKMGKKK